MTWTVARRDVAVAAGRVNAFASRHPTLAAVAGYVLIIVSLFRELVFDGRVLFERDIHVFWYTQVESFVRIVTTPAWPLWDPYASFGQPLLADPSAQILYPPTWLNLLMRPWVYCTLFVLCHLVFSGVGAFRLARRLGIAGIAAFTTGALWITSGPLLLLVNNIPHFTGATWLPWVLLAARRTAELPSWKRTVTWSAVLAGQILAGSADMCVLGLLGSAVLVVASAVPCALREIWRRLVASGLAVCLALGLTAAMLLPAIEVVSHSSRRALPEAIRTAWSLHPIRLLELVLPLPWRYLAVNPDLRTAAFQDRDPFLHSVYLGLATVALLLSATTTRRRGLLLVLLSIVAVGLPLALGRYLPFYGWLTYLVPPLKALRYPQKILLLVSLAVALIAGLGLDAWQALGTTRARWIRRVVLPLAALALSVWAALWFLHARAATIGPVFSGLTLSPDASGMAVAAVTQRLLPACVMLSIATGLALFRLWRRFAVSSALLLACVAVADLYTAHRDLNPTATRDLFRCRPEVLDRLPPQAGSRLYVHDYMRMGGDVQRYLGGEQPYTPARIPRGWSVAEAGTLAVRDALIPPMAGAWGYESAYEINFRGLYSDALALLTSMLREAEDAPSAHLRLLQVGAVRDVIALHTKGLEHLQPAGTVQSFVLSRPLQILRVPQPLPRVYAVSGTRILDGEKAIQLLAAPRFDPRSEVILAAGLARPPDPQFTASCRVVDFRPGHVALDVALSSPGYVVTVDAFDPGWHGRVDGQPCPVLRANTAFRAVAVPAGKHRVVFSYWPNTLWWGVGVSLGALLLVLAVAAGSRAPAASGADHSGEVRLTEKAPEDAS